MDIKFEKDGITKMANARFTEDLEAVGWRVVEEEREAENPKPRGRPKKVENDYS